MADVTTSGVPLLAPTPDDADSVRQAALDHLWFPMQQWDDLADDGGLIVIVEGKGAKLRDIDGKWYYDGIAGQMLVNAGHGWAEIGEAMAEQVSRVHYAGAFYYATPPAIALAEKVASLAPGDLNHVMFMSGGSEAIETALKAAYKFHANNGQPNRNLFIARKGSYHGTSLGALLINTAGNVNREAFGAILPDNVRFAPQPFLYHCEFDSETQEECDTKCAQAVADMIEAEGPDNVAGVIAEPISAGAGIVVPGPKYLQLLREACDHYGVLLIADEVVTGFGRTGTWFAVEHSGVVPDLITFAKGISSGYVPLGGCIARDHVHEAFKGGGDRTFTHGFTYGNHPVSTAGGLANLQIFEREGIVENSATQGAYLFERLESLYEHPAVGDVRGGLGLFAAVELVRDKDTKEPLISVEGAEQLIRQRAAEHGLLTRLGRDIALAPPLILTRDEVDEIVDIIDRTISDVEQELGLT